MGSGFEIDVSGQLAGVGCLLGVLDKQLNNAVDRALRKTAKWLSVHSLREIGQELQIKQQAIKPRFKVYPQIRGKEVKLWVGLFPIAVHHLGASRQTADGVNVGKRRFQSAFLASAGNGPEMVWRRRGSERLPVERVMEDIAGPVESILRRFERRAVARFAEIFEQEVRFELGKIKA